MSALKILYFQGTEPYHFKDDTEKKELHQIGENLRQKLSHFTEDINTENGHIAVYVTPTTRHDPYKNFNFHVAIEGVSAHLHEKIKKAGALS